MAGPDAIISPTALPPPEVITAILCQNMPRVCYAYLVAPSQQSPEHGI